MVNPAARRQLIRAVTSVMARPLTTMHAILLDRLVEELSAEGDLAPDWRDTFLAVPRHLFIPDTVWQRDPTIDGPHDLVPVHRHERPQTGGRLPTRTAL